MTNEETAEVIASAVRYVANGTDKSFFSKEETHCGAARAWTGGPLLVRLAMINIVSWLAYVGRGGRESASLKIQGSGPLNAISCALEAGGKLAQVFHVAEGSLHWNDEVSAESRVAAAAYVAAHHKPVMHVSHTADDKEKSGE